MTTHDNGRDDGRNANCEQALERVTDRLHGLLAPAESRELDRHLEGCAACRTEAGELTTLWEGLARLDEPVPIERMRVRFHDALQAFEAEMDAAAPAPSAGLGQKIAAWFGIGGGALQPAGLLAAGALMLVVGLGVGFNVGGRGSEVDRLRVEMDRMNRTLSLSLLQNGSASDRLQGVAYSQNATGDATVVQALIDAAQYDANANVRLAAVEALAGIADQPAVGSQLLRALDQEPSPLIKLTLAEVLVSQGVAGSDDALARLLDDDDLDPSVKERLTEISEGPF
ncbi:hypothetical protein ABI59_22090 [Acidobacteria bacterium Mor1]|nr:hypothetical protein ABI59_22090 [Acidobacteria bacterium Mor1]